jgi:tetratricopeptide (TPR) repeat protein
MPIEGPLRELGIHDVFQLLDLSRKTGRLRVTSSLRDNEGTVFFVTGRIVGASIRSNPHPIGQLLLRAGRITESELDAARAVQRQPGEVRRIGEILVAHGALSSRELERQVRSQIEAVVFELMSWQEGYFSFTEESPESAPVASTSGIATEAVLMEGARRIDEWARIAHRVPHLGVIPALAISTAGHAPRLELLPNEWEVLAAIDGDSDLRGVAASLGRSDFDVARIVYGLLATGIIELREPAPRSAGDSPDTERDPVVLLADAREALHANRPHDALQLAERAVSAAPGNADVHVEVARALSALDRTGESDEAIRRALEIDPHSAAALMLAANGCVRHGDLQTAMAFWQRIVLGCPDAPEAERARQGIAHAAQLSNLVGASHD